MEVKMQKEERNPILGKQSIAPNDPVYLVESASVVGKKEGEGPLGNLFDLVGEDDMFGCKSWEEAESCLQREALTCAIQKAGWKKEDARFLFAGDLLGQEIATSFGLEQFDRPLFGLYGACSTCGLSLMLASLIIAGGFAEKAACVTSSHFASAEKEFRFPLGYGNQRPLSATWTVTGSGAFLLAREADCGKRPARAAITGMTPGKIVDFGLKDSMNMGACMAPAAASTIGQHLKDFGRRPVDYDKIITGDLGKVGQTVLLDLLEKDGIDISGRHMDCGIEIYDAEEQDTHAGGSGCGCSAVVLSAYILRMLEEGVWKRVLFAPTGALLSKTSFNEGKAVPGICHCLVLESLQQKKTCGSGTDSLQ
ncbi:MAG TPA: stage V sporulation protein AD [Candidatus Eisenbergiella merdipullorum]|uniref:Stage V sporulation protein AD n=1 Tax=Candidatus Eisenbergiella merdipullorum TaxID=2838553 RepID=A0A9D2I5X2_9FIRM|nr:stage V sporulation protein AD [Candidatus Eisenbergiella merdipullorum]